MCSYPLSHPFRLFSKFLQVTNIIKWLGYTIYCLRKWYTLGLRNFQLIHILLWVSHIAINLYKLQKFSCYYFCNLVCLFFPWEVLASFRQLARYHLDSMSCFYSLLWFWSRREVHLLGGSYHCGSQHGPQTIVPWRALTTVKSFYFFRFRFHCTRV